MNNASMFKTEKIFNEKFFEMGHAYMIKDCDGNETYALLNKISRHKLRFTYIGGNITLSNLSSMRTIDINEVLSGDIIIIPLILPTDVKEKSPSEIIRDNLGIGIIPGPIE